MKIKMFIIAVVVCSFLVVLSVKTAGPGDYGLEAALNATEGALSKTVGGASNMAELAGVIVNAALSLIGIIFFVLMLYAGIMWMKAMGNTEDVTKSKEIMTAAVIGLVIISAAYAVSNFVFTKLKGSGSGGGGTKETSITDGTICQIEKEDWSVNVVLAGKSGLWNCGKDSNGKGIGSCLLNAGNCHPSCRFENASGKCYKAACDGTTTFKPTKGTCPDGNCCVTTKP